MLLKSVVFFLKSVMIFVANESYFVSDFINVGIVYFVFSTNLFFCCKSTNFMLGIYNKFVSIMVIVMKILYSQQFFFVVKVQNLC